MSTQIISQSFDSMPVFFQSDAYINATKAARHFNKQVGDYLRLDRTKEYVAELSSALFPETGNPVSEENQLVIVKKGGQPEEQGTWLHPKLTIDFARWLSAKFAVWCDAQIEKILHPTYAQLDPPSITKSQQGILFNAVRLIAQTDNKIHAAIWSRFQHHFNLASYKDLPINRFADAVAYLEKLRDEYLGGPVEMLYISRNELESAVAERVQALQGELLEAPKSEPESLLSLELQSPDGNIEKTSISFKANGFSHGRWTVVLVDGHLSIRTIQPGEFLTTSAKLPGYINDPMGGLVAYRDLPDIISAAAARMKCTALKA